MRPLWAPWAPAVSPLGGGVPGMNGVGLVYALRRVTPCPTGPPPAGARHGGRGGGRRRGGSLRTGRGCDGGIADRGDWHGCSLGGVVCKMTGASAHPRGASREACRLVGATVPPSTAASNGSGQIRSSRRAAIVNPRSSAPALAGPTSPAVRATGAGARRGATPEPGRRADDRGLPTSGRGDWAGDAQGRDERPDTRLDPDRDGGDACARAHGVRRGPVDARSAEPAGARDRRPVVVDARRRGVRAARRARAAVRRLAPAPRARAAGGRPARRAGLQRPRGHLRDGRAAAGARGRVRRGELLGRERDRRSRARQHGDDGRRDRHTSGSGTCAIRGAARSPRTRSTSPCARASTPCCAPTT